jgi:hypothetical protein
MRFLVSLVLVAGCASHGSTPDASPTSEEVACESKGTTFPPLEKACTVASDCFVAQHMVSCCGTLVALGFNVSAKPAFTAAEATCSMAYPGCGCAQGPTKAEDGKFDLQNTISVRCDTGLCRTFVP